MNACRYCGHENDPAATYCRGCASEILPLEPAPAPPVFPRSQLQPRYLNLANVEGAFDFEDGFSRPQWDTIRAAIESTIEPEDQGLAWDEATVQWLCQTAADLGGNYWLTESESFFLLSPVSLVTASNLLRFAERARDVIQRNLKDVAWRPTNREVILMLEDEDDYYTYIAHFFESDQIPRTVGIHLRSGYPHVALVFRNEADACHTIAHELTHAALHGLPAPLWVEEGVCETLRRMIGGPQVATGEGNSNAYWAAVSGWTPPVMWGERSEQHHEFWNEKNIQEFWAGVSFGGEEEPQRLSYSLAEVIVHLLSGDHDGFLAFISRAHYDDAGQTAALECLGRNLGDVVAEFLGPGNWRPYRKAMVDIWAVAQPKSDSTTG